MDPETLARLQAYAGGGGMGYPAMNMAPSAAPGTPPNVTGTAAWFNGRPRMIAPAWQGGGLPIPPELVAPPGTPDITSAGAVPPGPRDGSSGGGGASQTGYGGPSILPQARGLAIPPNALQFNWPASSTPTGMPNPPPAVPIANTPIGGGAGNVMEAPTGKRRMVPATATASVPASSRFVQITRPNKDVAGGALSRGGPPQMTALDLSGLFRRS